jgi:competence protein ComEC
MYIDYIINSTFGFFLGLLIAYKTTFSSQIFFVSFVLFIINILIHYIVRKRFLKIKYETSILISILFLFLSFGILYGQFNISQDLLKNEYYEKNISHNETFVGEIKDIKYTENSTSLIVKLLNIEKINNIQIKIITEKTDKYNFGDILSFTGKLSLNEILLPTIKDKINMSFNIKDYNYSQEILGQVVFPKITVIKNNSSILNKIKNLKKEIVNNLKENPLRETLAISVGTTLGDSSLFSKKELDDFRYSSLSHIIVLSGFNISILILFFSLIFLRLNIKLKWRVLLTIFFIIFFIFFVGYQTSIIRAGIMGSMLLIANIFGKQYIAKQGLFLSAFIMMIMNSKIAVYDLSFHLSFLATFGILYLTPIINNYDFFKNKKNTLTKNLLEIFVITLSVQIMVSPYIMFVFHKISLFGIIANILVVPIIPIIMFFGFLIIIFNFLIPFISTLLIYINYLFSSYVFYIAKFFSSFELSKIETSISFFTMIIIYFIIILLIYFETKRFRIKKYLEMENV